MINDKEIEEALKNIAELKEALNHNVTSLKPAFISKDFLHAFRLTILIFSLATLITAGTTYQYTSFSKAPRIFFIITISLIIASAVFIIQRKIKLLRTTEIQSLRGLFTFKSVTSLYLSIFSSFIVAFLLYLVLNMRFQASWLLLPLFIIAYGICIIISGKALDMKSLIISGFVTIFIGLTTIAFFQTHLFLWSMVDITIILFTLYGAFAHSFNRGL